MSQLSVESSQVPVAPRSWVRVPWGIALGALVAVPLSYLLSYAAFLVAMLGLFYFVLFGLLIGAAMYRAWLPLRPMSRAPVGVGVAIVALVGWGGALTWEGLTFPSDVGKEALKQVVKLPGKTGADVRAAAADEARLFLKQHYPPGGVWGYLRWAMSEKTVKIPILGVTDPRPIVYRSNGWMFKLRVLLSCVGLTLAILSQVKPLTRPADPVPGPDQAGPTVALSEREISARN